MKLNFYDLTGKNAKGSVLTEPNTSYIVEKLGEPKRFSTTLRTDKPPKLAIGDRTSIGGKPFFITREPRVKKLNTEDFSTELDLEEASGLLRRVILQNPIDERTDFDYTATPREHLDLVIQCANKRLPIPDLVWKADKRVIEGEVKHIKYEGVTCLEALKLIADTFQVEYRTDITTISLEGDDTLRRDPLKLAYGKGKGLLSGLERVQYNDTPRATVLYVKGTDRNIAKGRLTLERGIFLRYEQGKVVRGYPDLSTPEGRKGWYVTSSNGQRIEEWHAPEDFLKGTQTLQAEATYENEEIYPSHVGTISSVQKVGSNYDFYDLDNVIDYEKYTIAGEQMSIAFQSGNLAGRELDASYNHTKKQFKLRSKDEDEVTLPNDTLCPKEGDKYIVLHVALPEEYIQEAERKLTEEAVKHLAQLRVKRYSYKADLDPVFLSNLEGKVNGRLSAGRYVELTDTDIAVGDPIIRIVGKRIYLDDPIRIEIELSNEVTERSYTERVQDLLNKSIDLTKKELNKDLTTTRQALPTSIHDTIKGSSELQELIRGRQGEQGVQGIQGVAGHTPNIRWSGTSLLIDDLQAVNLKGEQGIQGIAGVNPKPSEVAELIATNSEYKARITQGLTTEEKVKEIARSLDSEIKGGGRNLVTQANIRKATTDDGYGWVFEKSTQDSILLVNGRDYPLAKTGDTVTLSILIRCDKSEWGASEWAIRVSDSQGSLEYFNPNKEVFGEFYKHSWTFALRDGGKLPTIQLYNHLWRKDENGKIKYNKRIEAKYVKLEFGTIVTDWTPAPEDVDSALATKADIATTTAIAKELGEYEEELGTLSIRVEEQGQQVREQRNQIGEQRKALTKYATELGNSQTVIQKLEKLTSQLKEGKLDTDGLPQHLKWLLDALNNGETTLEGGLMLTKIIGLSNHEGKITAYLSGYNEGGGKVLRAGIGLQTNTKKSSVIDYLKSLGFANTDEIVYATTAGNELAFTWLLNWAKKQPIPCDLLHKQYNLGLVDFPESFKPTTQVTYREHIDLGTEEVAIYHDGRGHFGDIYLNRDVIDFKRSETAKPYLSVGEADAEFIDDFLKKVRTDTTPINEGSINLNNSNREYTRTLTAPENGTSLKITIEKLKSEAYKVFGGAESWLILYLDGQALGAWQGETESKFVKNPLNDEISLQTDYTPKEASNLSYSLYLNKGSHTLKFAIVGNNKGEAEITGLKASLYYDSGQTQTYIRGSGLRFFGSADRFVDIDYRKQVYRGDDTAMGGKWWHWDDNPYTMRVKGGVKVDKLTADEVETTGAVLCGGRVDERGYFASSFGKYKNKRGESKPIAAYDKSNNIFKVYHSIGHQNYTPIVTSAAGAWGDVPQIVGVWSYSFDIKFINSNNQASYGWPFTFVCYKGD